MLTYYDYNGSKFESAQTHFSKETQNFPGKEGVRNKENAKNIPKKGKSRAGPTCAPSLCLRA